MPECEVFQVAANKMIYKLKIEIHDLTVDLTPYATAPPIVLNLILKIFIYTF